MVEQIVDLSHLRPVAELHTDLLTLAIKGVDELVVRLDDIFTGDRLVLLGGTDTLGQGIVMLRHLAGQGVQNPDELLVLLGNETDHREGRTPQSVGLQLVLDVGGNLSAGGIDGDGRVGDNHGDRNPHGVEALDLRNTVGEVAGVDEGLDLLGDGVGLVIVDDTALGHGEERSDLGVGLVEGGKAALRVIDQPAPDILELAVEIVDTSTEEGHTAVQLSGKELGDRAGEVVLASGLGGAGGVEPWENANCLVREGVDVHGVCPWGVGVEVCPLPRRGGGVEFYLQEIRYFFSPTMEP